MQLLPVTVLRPHPHSKGQKPCPLHLEDCKSLEHLPFFLHFFGDLENSTTLQPPHQFSFRPQSRLPALRRRGGRGRVALGRGSEAEALQGGPRRTSEPLGCDA